ncbi:MAG: FAD-binding protein [Firmicutes bacterium]|nr:FAD-binding protein [Bacillota bacterium]
MKYNPVTPQVIDKLKAIVGEHFIVLDEEKLKVYACDESIPKPGRLPEVVVKPKDAEEISQIMRLANEYHIPVTPRGAGTGLSGGAIPVCGGIVLSLERMNRILEIDEENLMMTVEPAVITNEVQRVAANKGFLYAGDPCSSESSFIGGNVAENAGGNKAIKYGTTGRYIYGLEVVLPTGEITFFGGKRVKDVTGYDFIHLLVGSEGTLGIITKIILKLIPLPKYKMDLLVPFNSMDAAIAMVPKIMTSRRVIPTSIEFMDKASLMLAEEYLGTKLPYDHAEAHLIIEVDGNNKEDLESEYEAIGKLCQENGALEVFVADNKNTQEKVWRARKAIAEAVKALSSGFCMEDVVVPISEIPKMMRAIAEISSKFNVRIISFGHAGDGNIHATFLKDEMSDARWEGMLPQALRELYSFAKEFGGTISGEHGIGSKRKKHLSMVLDDAQIELIRRIKRAFDPNLILNPAKIVDDNEPK